MPILYIVTIVPAILFIISLFQLIKACKVKEQLEIKHKISLLRSFRFIVWGYIILIFGLALMALFSGGFNGLRVPAYALFMAYILLNLLMFGIRSAFVANTRYEEPSEDDEAIKKKI